MTGNNGNTVSLAISGVGGQGVLTLADVLAKAALNDGLNVRVGEIHGMAQRGGHVVCTVRIGERVRGPIVDAGTADVLVGFEPVEVLREIALVRRQGLVLMSSHVQYPVAVSMGKAEYPSHEEIQKAIRRFTDRVVEFDAFKLAEDAGSTRALNMVMFGAIIGSDETPITKQAAFEAIRASFPERYEKINIKAAENGMAQMKDR
ncbi:indolepyruvate ferredoxin oxidoreductase subunit beta [Candidatus Thorarchaeota archaeon]|jgi:indolepyruvate ferredoxin oxidoreductase beta subunit|nr:MAG: indolepyruvate ferredoxin oxidoreductase subunit beta [Candidatus Thorarchaeota archaeon]